jgi:uncharacterized protein
LDFKPIQLERAEFYHQHLKQTPQVASDYSFANIWGWAREYGLEWAFSDDLVWIRQNSPQPVYWAPVGPWEKINWPGVLRENDFKPGFTRVPEVLADLWRRQAGELLRIEEDRANWDYIYDVEELVTLRGNRFHKKKNLLNQFKKQNTYHYEPFSTAMIDQALALQDDWCTWRDCEDSDVLSAENRAIQRVFVYWDRFPELLGGAIMVEDLIVAYTIAEPLDQDTVVIHFEKGCPAHKGIYQAINQMFLESLEGRFHYVNREQDLGDEGLRKAKLSYHPVTFDQKYRAHLTS